MYLYRSFNTWYCLLSIYKYIKQNKNDDAVDDDHHYSLKK